MSVERGFAQWRFFWTMALLVALCLTEPAPHIEPAIRTYAVVSPASLAATGNVTYGVSGSWNNSPFAGWPQNVVATTLAVPFAVIQRQTGSRVDYGSNEP